MTKIRTICSAVIVGLLLQGCIANDVTRIPSNVDNLYPQKPTQKTIQGSQEQYIESRVFRYTFDEVYDAVYDATFSLGLAIVKTDESIGRLVGTGRLQKPHFAHVTFAIYIEEINSDPTTKTTIVVDRFGAPNKTWHSTYIGDNADDVCMMIFSELQKTLSSF